MMKKNMLLRVGLWLVFPAAFNLLFFLVFGADHSAAVWISYGVFHFSYLMMILAPYLGGKSRESGTFGLTLSVPATLYFAAELIAFVVFLIFSGGYLLSLVVHIILTALFLILFLSTLLANNRSSEALDRQRAEIMFQQTAAARVKLLVGRMSDRQADHVVEKAYDRLNAAPTRSVPEVKETEAEILDCISALEDAVERDSSSDVAALCNEIMYLVNVRNQHLKLYH